MIVRPYYLDILKTYRDVPLVKILAGIRRCGKSTILDMLKDDLLGSGIAADHVIHLRYTSEELDDGMTAKQMYRDIKEKMTDGERYYLLLDEVQEVDGWEKAVNSLLEDSNTDIYVTGSNSKLMSSEISTYLTGRYISIPVFTLSFAEYLEFKKDSGRTPKELLNEYIRMGGFPIVALGNFDERSSYRCQRYDMQGKTVLKTQEKFYLADASLKYCMMGFNPKSVAAMLENIVYFELRRKGYDVYIGKNATKEIDFVAVRRDERIYVQVCRNLPEESDREVANLLEIKDHYPKYVVTLDELAAGNINGVKIVHLADFLLSKDY